MAAEYAVVRMGILAAITVAVGAFGIYVNCEGDHECGRGKYCYTSSGHCVPCTSCQIHNRENRTSYPYCAKSAVDCGKCLSGFEEEVFTTGEVRDTCIPILSQAENSYTILFIFLGVVAVCVFLTSTAFGYRLYRKQVTECGQNVREECALQDQSLSTNNSPLLDIRTAAAVSDTRETCFNFCGEKDFHPLQQARPFREPDAPYIDNAEEQDEPPHTPPHLHDDETLESTWSLPSYGQAIQAANTNETSNDETDGNEPPASNQSADPANSSLDSGLSNSPSATSSTSLPLRPFQGLGSSSSTAVADDQPLTVHSRSHSDDDVSTSARSPKRARRDSGAQSLNDDAVPPNVMVVNVQNCTTGIHE